MDVRTALVSMRDELNMRQTDLATALGVTYVTVNRWETGKNTPSRAMSLAIVAFASAHGVSKVCQAALKEALIAPSKNDGLDSLKNAEVAQINSLVNNSSNAVMVCDAQTHELLYLNRQAGKMTGQSVEQARGQKCYQYFLHRDTPCEDCPLKNDTADAFFTMEYESPVTGCRYMRRSKMLSWNGKKAHLEYITDISALRKANRELELSREMMALACREAGMWMFVLNVKTGTAHLDAVVRDALKLPAAIPDFMEVIRERGMVLPEYQQTIRGMLPALRQGRPAVSVVVQTSFPAGRTHWVRLRATVISADEKGAPLSAVCSAQVIDQEKALEARIHFEHARIIESRHDLMGYAVADITNNTIVEQHQLLDKWPAHVADSVYDDVVEIAKKNIEPPEAQARFARAHDRAALIRRFQSGQLGDTLEYLLHQPDGNLVWIRTELKLMLEPISGAVYLYEYAFATHSNKIMEGLLAQAAQNEYELFGSITMITGQMTLISFAEDDRRSRLAFTDYDEERRAYCAKYIETGRQAGFLQKTGLQAIQNKLKTCKTYRITFTAAEGGRKGTKVAQFTRYDGSGQFCLFSLLDLTVFMDTLERMDSPDAEAENDNA